MKALLIHGSCDKEEYFDDQYPSLSNSHWFPWLQKQLLIKEIFTQTPEMPEPFQPNYQLWKSEFERYPVDKDTILVGHSCGGGFLVRWLSENKQTIKKLILVAPWMDPSNRSTDSFFEFEIDPQLADRCQSIEILISDDEDVEGVQESVQTLSQSFPKAHLHQFSGMGHFTFDPMGTEKFPELLDLVLKDN